VKPARAHREAGPSAEPGRRRPAVAGRQRLDVLLMDRGLAASREKAARLILAGAVRVDGQRVDKAGALVRVDAPVAVDRGPRFVSRGGDKLAGALDAFGLDPAGLICLDVGASTGGFTHCLLERGAARVYALDVGQGQLDATLRADGRVVVMDRVNARSLPRDAFAPPPRLATVDVSFISLEKVLPAVLGALAPDGEVIALVKPQFEVGRERVGKGGVVRSARDHRAVLERVARFAVLMGAHARGVAASPLRGPKGNREFFLWLSRTGRTASDFCDAIARVAEETV
jgi:23S rRNA (cytidine1920-2'-O)/16S rRNA (cytidine1409-2'-O)-methyltransferase